MCLRASLVAVVVALTVVFSLFASSMRSPMETALGVAFARACAAEAASTNQSQPRLRIDHEDAHADDAPALAPSSETTKTAASQPERNGDGDLGMRVIALAPPTALKRLANGDDYPGVERTFADAPTRGRARLMVFLI